MYDNRFLMIDNYLSMKYKHDVHCVKIFEIWIFSVPYLPAFGLNTYLSVISPNAGKYRPEKSPYRTLFVRLYIYTMKVKIPCPLLSENIVHSPTFQNPAYGLLQVGCKSEKQQ